jgi:hypothetical protein
MDNPIQNNSSSPPLSINGHNTKLPSKISQRIQQNVYSSNTSDGDQVPFRYKWAKERGKWQPTYHINVKTNRERERENESKKIENVEIISP